MTGRIFHIYIVTAYIYFFLSLEITTNSEMESISASSYAQYRFTIIQQKENRNLKNNNNNKSKKKLKKRWEEGGGYKTMYKIDK